MSKSIVEVKVVDQETVEVTSMDKEGNKTIETLVRASDLSQYDESTQIICQDLWGAN